MYVCSNMDNKGDSDMTQHPQMEYIITEEQLKSLLSWGLGIGINEPLEPESFELYPIPDGEEILQEVRSHPYTAKSEQEIIKKYEHWLDIKERRALKAGAFNHAEAFHDAHEYLFELRKQEGQR